ncbi:MAG: pyridoxamine 5'-phosphate oxidase family protein [Winogradskyella sp.]|uniref:pyridoxamine 5'-phosphate oxidase family protein n=1 Tax=Winogradskyella sp. TaxID=1883156 RepID=UPI0017B53B44|nr:pyridoxamine 5'-phosphate oxidase family protein [Winogradskyella sp.]MBT8245268.1 pyridoxamine 5'-phosphate oxidase family protein [Winogradskyella sp.]NNK22709.1 pyridoxamine 5'-phosphate oxidase family protein [Winogradskyella sp.]
MEEHFFEELKRELINGPTKKRHPFRYFSLATIHKQTARQRTVVLRKTLQDTTLLIYTDARSQKIKDIKTNNNVSALFYHPKKLIQVRVEGEAHIITDQQEIRNYWNNISENSRKDYITSRHPGNQIANPENISYNEEKHHFCAIKIIPKQIEYLKLKRPNHIRIVFAKTETNWEGQFLVP